MRSYCGGLETILDKADKTKYKQQIKRARQKGMTPIELAQMKAIAKKHADEMVQEANEKAFVQLLAIPCLILGEDYWKKTAKQKIPKFIEDVASLYESYQQGNVTDQDLADALNDMAGIEIEAEWLRTKGK